MTPSFAATERLRPYSGAEGHGWAQQHLAPADDGGVADAEPCHLY